MRLSLAPLCLYNLYIYLYFFCYCFLLDLYSHSLQRGRSVFYDEFGDRYCRDTVCTYITAGSPINTSAATLHSFWPSHSSQRCIAFGIYACNKPEMPYSNDPGVQRIGQMSFDLPLHAMHLPSDDRGVNVSITKLRGKLPITSPLISNNLISSDTNIIRSFVSHTLSS